MQCSSVVCSLAKWKDIRPRRPEFGPEGKHFVSGNRLFLFLGDEQEAAKLRLTGGGGAQRPFWRVNEPIKTGARSARARMRGQNPLVMLYLGPVNSVKKSAKSKNTVGGGGGWRWCTLRFADFFIHVARGKLTKFPPAIVPIPVRTRQINPKFFYFQ